MVSGRENRRAKIAAPPARRKTVSRAADSLSYPPRGLSREEAARYVGLGTTKFDELVKEGKMPKPKRVGSRTVWDRVALDIAFTDLPDVDSGNFFDRLYAVK